MTKIQMKIYRDGNRPAAHFIVSQKGESMNIETARGIAARIWCDQDFEHMEMDVDLAEEIAKKLMVYANKPIHKADAGHCGNCGAEQRIAKTVLKWC